MSFVIMKMSMWVNKGTRHLSCWIVWVATKTEFWFNYLLVTSVQGEILLMAVLLMNLFVYKWHWWWMFDEANEWLTVWSEVSWLVTGLRSVWHLVLRLLIFYASSFLTPLSPVESSTVFKVKTNLQILFRGKANIWVVMIWKKRKMHKSLVSLKVCSWTTDVCWKECITWVEINHWLTQLFLLLMCLNISEDQRRDGSDRPGYISSGSCLCEKRLRDEQRSQTNA